MRDLTKSLARTEPRTTAKINKSSIREKNKMKKSTKKPKLKTKSKVTPKLKTKR
jgi:hypothetical protein